ncbi:unnamed protein product, partial [Owenia fusiformis]
DRICNSFNIRRDVKVCELNGENSGLIVKSNLSDHFCLGPDSSACIKNPTTILDEQSTTPMPGICTHMLISGDIYYVKDENITASGARDNDHLPEKSRLDSSGVWSPSANDVNQWIQADLGEVMIVTEVVTQGRQDSNEMVSSYKLLYGETDDNLEEYGQILPGGTDINDRIANLIEPPVLASSMSSDALNRIKMQFCYRCHKCK